MCFGRSLKAGPDEGDINENSRPVNSDKPNRADAAMVTQESFEPPPGPPPNQRYNNFTPPDGPPPGRLEQYDAPSGPPPGHSQPQPYHDWTAIPDTALLPPPPTLGHEISPTNNASLADAERAHEFCNRNNLAVPKSVQAADLNALANGDVRLTRPREFSGDVIRLSQTEGSWRVQTKKKNRDSCLMTTLPMFSTLEHSPLATEVPKTVYFEIRIISLGAAGNDENGIAIGYCAQPYPTWRLPGWERGSLGVHGDDGRKYVNDTFGGKDFANPFEVGETIGLGLTFSLPESPPAYSVDSATSIASKVEVFMTRGGKKVGGWDVHEERDNQDNNEGVEGLEGLHDIYGAIGLFGSVEFEVFFSYKDWLFKP
jgi:SPRY domain